MRKALRKQGGESLSVLCPSGVCRELGIGSGFSNAELGLRLRYEIQRSFAPYIGVTYDQSFGATADFARAAGERTSTTSFVIGLRAWF